MLKIEIIAGQCSAGELTATGDYLRALAAARTAQVKESNTVTLTIEADASQAIAEIERVQAAVARGSPEQAVVVQPATIDPLASALIQASLEINEAFSAGGKIDPLDLPDAGVDIGPVVTDSPFAAFQAQAAKSAPPNVAPSTVAVDPPPTVLVAPPASSIVLPALPVLPVPPVLPAVAPPAAPTTGVETDKDGLPWDRRIHSSSKNKNADGTWRRMRNVDEGIVATVGAELRAVMGIVPAEAPWPFKGGAPDAEPSLPAPPPSVATDGAYTFDNLMEQMVPLMSAQRLNMADVTEACAEVGVPGGMAMMMNRPDLLEAARDAILRRVRP